MPPNQTKHARYLQPGDLILYENTVYRVTSTPRLSPHFSFYVHIDLIDVDTQQENTITAFPMQIITLHLTH